MIRIGEAELWHGNGQTWSLFVNSCSDATSSLVDSDIVNLITILQQIIPIIGKANQFVWWSGSREFSIKSIYSRLLSCVIQDFQPTNALKRALNCVWISKVPYNIQLFTWRSLLKLLQTRYELTKRGIISGVHSLVCLLCLGSEEAHTHLFVYWLVVVEV